MVEGPKYHRHAELLRTLLKRRLKAVLRVETAEQGAGLRALLGCLVLEVFAVGKELFVVFALKWDEQRRGGSFRLHFGHGGGYLVESSEPVPTGEIGPLNPWGPKADGGGHCRDGSAAVILEFSAVGAEESQGEVHGRAYGDTLKFSPWNDLGSSFGMCSHEYLRSVEARSIFDINTSWERFAWESACDLFLESEELVVDLIMDQSRLPGVGNIIKCEGLFAARIFPLRRCCELSRAEWKDLLVALHRFSTQWYEHCQKSCNGQQMGCCHLMRIYGHWNCSFCQQPVSLIKEGKRQRITYFCPQCQPRQPNMTTETGSVRQHRHEIKVTLKPCHCGLQPAVLQVRAGNSAASWDDRRPYLSCPRKRGSRYDDGGRGIPGPWDGCGFHCWLDEVMSLPECYCGKPALLRRVVSASPGNGRHFWRCPGSSSRCCYRCWVTFTVPSGSSGGRWRKVGARSQNGGDTALPIEACKQDVPFTAISSDPETSSSEKGDRNGYRDDKPQNLRCTGRPVVTAGKAKRWSTR